MKGYYTDISEISVYNWNKCTKGDLRYTRIRLKVGKKKKDFKMWDSVYDSYLKRYGLNSTYAYIRELQHDLALIQCDFVIEGDRFLLNKINVITETIKDVLKKTSKDSLDANSILIIASKWIGYKLPDVSTTVLELHDILKMMKEEFDKAKKNKKPKK